MSQEKNHAFLLTALGTPDMKELPAIFYLAGDGPLTEENKALATQLGIADKVVFGGFRRDLPKLYKGSDCYLLCSKYESLPLSIREGMGASLPILSTNVGGIAEAVEDGKSGILIPPGDQSAMTAGIKTLTVNSETRQHMGARGNEIYHEKFDYNTWIQLTLKLMSEQKEAFAAKWK